MKKKGRERCRAQQALCTCCLQSQRRVLLIVVRHFKVAHIVINKNLKSMPFGTKKQCADETSTGVEDVRELDQNSILQVTTF